jgi:uncharacterized Ntn-hydrolase superfamily protein
MLGGRKLHLELETDRFAAGTPIVLPNDLSQFQFAVESDNHAAHAARMRVRGLAAGEYVVSSESERIATVKVEDQGEKLGDGAELRIPVPQRGRSERITVERVTRPRANTFSIVAFDPGTGDLGIAVASKVLGVGSIVPYAKAGVGAIATQSAANTGYGPEGLILLAAGKTAKETARVLTGADGERETRQLGIVDAKGNVVAFSGSKCNGWFGHIQGDHFTVQGNLLAGEEVLKKMAADYEEARQTKDSELADWLMAALKAGDAAGGDKRGKQSAAILVVRDKAGYGGNDRYIDLRVEDSEEPIAELDRLLKVHKQYFAWAHEHPPRRDGSKTTQDEEHKN